MGNRLQFLNTTGNDGLDRELQSIRATLDSLQSKVLSLSATTTTTTTTTTGGTGRGATFLTDLGDTLITGSAQNNMLWYDGTQWINVPTSFYYPVVVADGATDDTATIQASINLAHTTGGGTVVLPIGTMRIATGLTMYSNVALIGQGVNATTLLCDDYNQEAILCREN